MRYSRRGGTFSGVARSPATRQRNPDIATRGAPGPKQMTWTACATRCAPSGRSAGSWRHIGWEEFWTTLQKKKAVLQNQRPNWACMENTMRKATWSAGWRSECSRKVCSATPKRSAEISTSLRKVSLRLCAVAGRSLSLRMCFRATFELASLYSELFLMWAQSSKSFSRRRGTPCRGAAARSGAFIPP